MSTSDLVTITAAIIVALPGLLGLWQSRRNSRTLKRVETQTDIVASRVTRANGAVRATDRVELP